MREKNTAKDQGLLAILALVILAFLWLVTKK